MTARLCTVQKQQTGLCTTHRILPYTKSFMSRGAYTTRIPFDAGENHVPTA